MIFKTWLTDLTKIQGIVNNIKSIELWANGATGLLNPNVVNNLSSAINGLNLQQAQLVLSTRKLTQEQMNQVLVQAGLIASEDKIQAELVQSALAQAGLSAEKQKAILSDLGLMNMRTGEILTIQACTKEELLNMLATKGVTGANAESIISILGLAGANGSATLSFSLLTKAIWGTVSALLANPITWIVLGLVALVGVLDLVTTSTAEYNKELNSLRDNLENVKSECSELESELKSCNDELTTTQDRLKELEKIKSPTFAEKEEYDNLIATNNELERKIALLELEQKAKNAEKNNAFIDTMQKDVNDGKEYWLDKDTGTIGKGDSMWAQIGGIRASDSTEADYIEQQFATRRSLINRLSETETKEEKARLQNYIDKIDSYLQSKASEWNKDSKGINYISNPTSDDDRAVNEWLDYIADFQDRMAIAISKEDAEANARYKTNTFNRIVDNWQFDDAVQGLQDLGKEGRVTAEMLDDPKYDEFIKKLVFLGVIESADNLNDIALAFNSVTEAAGSKNSFDNFNRSFSDIFSLKDANDTLTALGKISESIDTIQDAYKTLSSAIDEYNENGVLSIDTIQSITELGSGYLDYLVDEKGNIRLDQEALLNLTLARLQDMRAQMQQRLFSQVESIQSETDANNFAAQSYREKAESIEMVTDALLEQKVKDLNISEEDKSKVLSAASKTLKQINAMFDSAATGIFLDPNQFIGGAGSSQSDFSETINLFEQRVKNLDNAISHLKSTMDNISGSSAKNNLVDAELGITGEKFQNYTDALAMYTQKANEAFSKLPADIAAKVKDGAVALTDFIGDDNKYVVEAIKDYESWADKVTDCKQELAELKKEIRQLELEKFNNIMEDFNNQFDFRENSKDLISKQIDLLKEAGELIGESFYKTQIDQSKKQLELLEAEKAQLVNQMSSAIGSGRIQKGTDEWLEMVNALSDVDGSILDCKKSIEEFDNSILDLHTAIFARIQEQFSNLDSEISNILDLFEEFEVSDDKGIWSKEGIAQMGLLTQQYELAQYQIQQYNNEIDELNAQYLAGRYSSTEYADKLADLNDGMWDSVKSAGSAKDAIINLNEARVENAVKGIENEIDAYKELIDAQIDALRASKDLHDYEKSIAEKTKSITDLERRIAAMALDDSAASVAKRKKLEQQLSEAKADLEETQYQHSIEVQEDALNAQLEAYEKERNDEIDTLRESLNDKETILANSFETVKGNASTVGQEIAAIATQHGITVSKALISSWQSGEHAIASYGEVLSQNTSTFIGNIMGVVNEVWNLQAQANTTADSLAWMFSTRADNLVDELNTSYYAEANLANMTNALQQSLVNTLERGYDVSSIVSAINSIKSAADSASDSIKKLGDVKNENVTKDNTVRIGGGAGGGSLPAFKALTYAGGTRSSKGNVIITDEEGCEMKLPKLSSGQYTIANEGTQILTKAETDNIFGWAKFDPKDFTSVNMAEYMDNLRAMSMPQVLPNNVNNNNSVNVHYDSMITVQGSLNSTDVKQMEAIANKAVDKMIDKIHDGITYGI